MAGSPRDSFNPSQGRLCRPSATRWRAAARSKSATAAPPRTSGTAIARATRPSWSGGGSSNGTTTLLDDGPGGLGHAVRLLAAAVGFLVAAALLDGHAVDLHQLVDHARGRRTRAGDQRRADAVDVDGFGAQCGDRELVEVAGDHDAGLVAPRPSSWARTWRVSTPRSPESMRTAPSCGTGRRDGVGDTGGDVVGVDQQRRADAQRVDLGTERGGLVGTRRGGVQQRERVRAGAQRGHPVAALRPRGSTIPRIRRGTRPAPHATAACSWVRREPISMSGRPCAALTMRAAADAMAVSWLRIDRASVSRITHSAKVPCMDSTGEPGKYISPSG